MPGRILLADDHTLFRQGVRALLEREGFSVVGEASDGAEAVRLARELHPDVGALDVSMPVRNGIEAARELRTLVPPMRTVLLTVHSERSYVLAALRAGVVGYVLKTQVFADLVQAIRAVLRGDHYVSPEVSAALVDAVVDPGAESRDPLTGRERGSSSWWPRGRAPAGSRRPSASA